MDKKVKKPVYKRKWFIALVVIILMGTVGDLLGGTDEEGEQLPVVENPVIDSADAEEVSTDNNDIEEVEDVVEKEPEVRTFSENQVALLEREYKNFDEDEIKSFANMLRDWSFLSEEDRNNFEGNYNRLVAEKKALEEEQAKVEREEREKAEAEAKAKAEAEEKARIDAYIKENTKTLGAGTFYAPDHIATGVYDVTFTGTGNFFINGNDGIDYNEIGGSIGVSMVRVYLTETAEIEIRGMKVNFVPVTPKLYPADGFTLYAGYWIVGKEVPPGRYEVKPGQGQFGNFFVDGKNSVNEILGGSFGVESVTINIEADDVINIRSMSEVVFTPVS